MNAARPSPTARFVASLLPAGWPDRDELLRTAERLDLAHAGDASRLLLRTFKRWRTTSSLPADARLRDLLGALGLLLGGIASEMRMRPRLDFVETIPNHQTAGEAGTGQSL